MLFFSPQIFAFYHVIPGIYILLLLTFKPALKIFIDCNQCIQKNNNKMMDNNEQNSQIVKMFSYFT